MPLPLQSPKAPFFPRTSRGQTREIFTTATDGSGETDRRPPRPVEDRREVNPWFVAGARGVRTQLVTDVEPANGPEAGHLPVSCCVKDEKSDDASLLSSRYPNLWKSSFRIITRGRCTLYITLKPYTLMIILNTK